jgi:glucose-6-phosphate dehydrogenase assembly protein OpcA
MTYRAGNTDLAWTRLTTWRIQLAAVLDQVASSPVTAVTVAGAFDSPSTLLLAAWLELALKVPVTLVATRAGMGMRSVRLCLAEKLRRLDADDVFGETVRSLGASALYRKNQVAQTIGRKPKRDRSVLIAV